MTRTIPSTIAVLSLLISAPSAFAEGTEGHGNAPMPQGYIKSAALLPLANHKSRVYWREVNGDVHLYYRGTADGLNEMLALFAKAQEPLREVHLLPGTGETMTFDRTPVACDWELHIPDGFYLHFANKENGTQVMEKHPTLKIHVSRVSPKTSPEGKLITDLVRQLDADQFAVREKASQELEKLGAVAETSLRGTLASKPSEEAARRIRLLLDKLKGVDLMGLRFPAGLTLLGMEELIERCKTGLKSADSQIRGFAVGNLGQLACYTDETIPVIIDHLKTEKHEYTRRSAAGALGNLGSRAKAALPLLKEGLTDPDKNIQGTYQQMIEWIEKPAKEAPVAKDAAGLREEIAGYIESKRAARE